MVTFDQSHSSSSATSWARPVSEPWPISERAMRMTTVSSGRITTQALTSGEPSAARAVLGAERDAQAEREAAAERGGADHEGTAIDVGIDHSWRPSLHASWQRREWPCADLLVGAAAADVGDGGVDVGVGRLRLGLEQLRDRHDHAGLAVAALRHVVVEPGLLHLVQTPSGDRPSMVVICAPATALDGHRAGARRDSVDMHGAGAALGDAATVFGAGHAERSRSTHSSGVSGSVSAVCEMPLTVSLIMASVLRESRCVGRT